ncbi:MAG: hypothetical protein ACR2MA_08560 [Egibacteraceae bacterium]
MLIEMGECGMDVNVSRSGDPTVVRTIDLTAPLDIVVFGPGDAANIARMLDLLAELPSTPREIAHEAAARAGAVHELMPGRHRLAAAPAVEFARNDAVAVAGLLDLLAEMPSTPPFVAEDARRLAAQTWRRLDGR